MAPAPRQKLPEISPISISDKVTLHVSREKDGKLRLGYAGMGRYEFFRSRGLRRPSRRRNLGAPEEALRIFERRRGLILDQAESPAA
jgi:hypothetical protein